MQKKNRKIYDSDGTIVESVENASMNDTVRISRNIQVFKENFDGSYIGSDIKVTDILENMAGYMTPNFRFVDTTEKGSCLICGKGTSISARKLCGDCMEELGERLYHMARKAIDNGDKEVTI